jgi:hypothetical protein
MTETIDEPTVLHVLQVRGLASAAQVAGSLGADVNAVEPLLRAAVDAGQARYREGRVTGYALTPAGRERAATLRQSALSVDEAERLGVVYEGFLEPNRVFKRLTTEWQQRAPDADQAPLLARLGTLHDTMAELVRGAAAVKPRFAVYQARFDRALAKLRAGDATAFARPLSDSYHDVWMELHEDLLSLLGRQRTEADE